MKLEQNIKSGISDSFGCDDVDVIALKSKDIATILENNPFSEEDIKGLYFTFCTDVVFI